MIRGTARREARRMIGAYGLHVSTPVQLDRLDELFAVRYADMYQHGMMGAVITPQYGWPVSPSNRARILLDHRLDDREARLTIAHEIGHALHQHPGNLSSLTLGLEEKHERQAWTIAAELLIPHKVVHEEREAGRVAMVCEVPLFMVEIWQSING